MPPPRKVYPPVPDPGLPFDLGALDDLDAPAPPTAPRRWWQRKARPVHTPTVALRDPRALLALVPEAEQSRRIRAALLSAGAHYAVPARITLLTGLDARDVDMWDHVVRDIVQRHTPFTVRLVGPEVVQDRTVCLRVVGGGAQRVATGAPGRPRRRALHPRRPAHRGGPDAAARRYVDGDEPRRAARPRHRRPQRARPPRGVPGVGGLRLRGDHGRRPAVPRLPAARMRIRRSAGYGRAPSREVSCSAPASPHRSSCCRSSPAPSVSPRPRAQHPRSSRSWRSSCRTTTGSEPRASRCSSTRCGTSRTSTSRWWHRRRTRPTPAGARPAARSPRPTRPPPPATRRPR